MFGAFQHCETRVREADKDRFLATLFAPAQRREALFALYAFDLEIDQVRGRITSPLPGEVRLQWWRDVLTGTEPGDAAANPVALALMETSRRYALPVPVLLNLIDAHTFDLYDEPMATLAELESYAVATSGATTRLAARILADGTDDGLEGSSRHAGIACAITAVLQRLGLHAARGQRYIPDELFARHGAKGADLFAGQMTAELLAVLADLRQIAGRHLAALKAEGVPLRLLPAFLPAALVPSALARMERRGADPLRPPLVPQWRRQWTLWRAARNPARYIGVKPDRA
jgi:phytoene synthase